MLSTSPRPILQNAKGYFMKNSKMARPAKTPDFLRQMVVAVDLADHSEATARYAAEIASCFGASLRMHGRGVGVTWGSRGGPRGGHVGVSR